MTKLAMQIVFTLMKSFERFGVLAISVSHVSVVLVSSQTEARVYHKSKLTQDIMCCTVLLGLKYNVYISRPHGSPLNLEDLCMHFSVLIIVCAPILGESKFAK